MNEPDVTLHLRGNGHVRTREKLVWVLGKGYRVRWSAETTSPPRGMASPIGVDHYRTEIGALLGLLRFWRSECRRARSAS